MSEKGEKLKQESWEKWAKSQEGQRCLEGTCAKKLLADRLRKAFFAGIDQRLVETFGGHTCQEIINDLQQRRNYFESVITIIKPLMGAAPTPEKERGKP